MIPANYLERVYAGWLGKVVGIRLGAPIEGWTYDRILKTHGEVGGYLAEYNDFAADDDSNGPLFFLRALGDLPPGDALTPQRIGEALLNYAPYEHGFFWWGGYGTSTEHTAYLNLRHGIPAPRSGSIQQNGATVAEQIGGQIFIDTWGLVSPGNPGQAARLSHMAASVTHDGNGIYGGVFVAVCVSLAFVRDSIPAIIEEALAYIPEDCEYARVARAVIDFHERHGADWRACFAYIHDNFGYDKYPGNCHIIPNSAVMILAMLYGGGDFSRTICICNMCGWDTDCNVGNVGAILGVFCGTDGIEAKWTLPVHDLLICSSVMGSLNIMDLPYGASYIAMLAYRLAGETIPEAFEGIIPGRLDSCHFEYPGSTHSLRVRAEGGDLRDVRLENSADAAHSGQRSLKVTCGSLAPEASLSLYKRTHYTPADFTDSRYDPSFSPLLYPGQTIHGSILLPAGAAPLRASLYARDHRGGKVFEGEPLSLTPGTWHSLRFQVPPGTDALLREAGFLLRTQGGAAAQGITVYVDDLYFDGAPRYRVDMAKETLEVWQGHHREISQFTRLKGLSYLEDGWLHLTCADFGELYTGRHDFTDYAAAFTLSPTVGEHHLVNFRVQGAIRSYAAGFWGGGHFALLKNQNGYTTLSRVPFDWRPGETYTIAVSARGNRLVVRCGETEIAFTDEKAPYLQGALGVSVHQGSHCRYQAIQVDL